MVRRDAPRAARTDNSDCLAADRASCRPATFPHATSSTTKAALRIMASCRPTLPNRYSCTPNTLADRSAFVLGYSSPRSRMIRSMSLCADSLVTPGVSFAITGKEWLPRLVAKRSWVKGR